MRKTETCRLQIQPANSVVCITCLATDRAVFSLEEAPEFLSICNGLALPTAGTVCYECRGRLIGILAFQRRALQAQAMLEGQMPTRHCLSTLSVKFISPSDTIHIKGDSVQVKEERLEYMLQVKDEIPECTMLIEPMVQLFEDQCKSEDEVGVEDDVDDVKSALALKERENTESRDGKRQKVQDPQILSHYSALEIEHSEVLVDLARTRDSVRYKRARFKCDLCAMPFSTEQLYRSHHRLHNEQRGCLACSICQQRFEDCEKLELHQKTHYTRYSCLHCRRTCSNYTQMYYHFKGVHEEIPRPCKECPATFTSNRDLKRHAHHAHPRKFACDTCGRLCATSDSLQRHRLLHDAKAELECHICHKKYKGDFNLKNHIRSVHELKASDAYCAECGLQFRTRGHYKRHLSSGRHVAVDDYRFECDHCGRRFVQKPTLRTHIEQMHLRESRYKCDVCQQSFHAAWVLSKHKRSKHSEKSQTQHTCYVCQKPFRIYKSLKEHMNIHLGRRPFECKLCDATFVYSAALYNHNNLVHLKKKRTKKYKNT